VTSVLVLSANVHPAPRSAEGIVTGALVDGLRRAGHDVAVVSATAHEPLDGAAPLPDDRRWVVAPAGGLPSWRHLPARSPRGAVARTVDRFGALAGRPPFSVRSWAAPAAEAVLDHLGDLPDDVVVWARGLPESSLAAALAARRRHDFPLVCSLGDPLPPVRGPWTGTDARVARLAAHQVHELGRLADAWTFPSRAVADEVATTGRLEPTRCFVLPHLVAEPAVPHDGDATAEANRLGLPVVAYAGSAYRWLVEGPLLRALGRAAHDGQLHLVLALRDADDAAIAAAHAVAPDATVHLDLMPRDAAQLVARADAVLVPAPRPDLLYTKVVEALRHAQPVLSVTPDDGTTARLVHEAGGVLVPADADDAQLDAAVRHLLAAAEDPERRTARAQVATRLAPAAVLRHAEQVLDFAVVHHQARSTGSPRPAPPVLDRWP
jgi:glycosyltransferase involved in cell wall biosynthesis